MERRRGLLQYKVLKVELHMEGRRGLLQYKVLEVELLVLECVNDKVSCVRR